MKTLIVTVLTVATIVLVGCPKPLPPNPTPPVVTDTDRCPAACSHMRDLKCEEADDIVMRDGSRVRCEQFCKDTQTQGVWLNPSCVERVASCDQIETTCYVGKSR